MPVLSVAQDGTEILRIPDICPRLISFFFPREQDSPVFWSVLMSPNLQIGVCLLDEPSCGDGAGMAALNGEVRRFGSLSELDQSGSIQWLTNMSYFTWQSKQAFRHSSVKSDQVLRAHLGNLVKEFGLQNMPKGDLALLLSQIAQNTINYTAMLTGKPIDQVTGSTQRLDWILRERALPKARYPLAADDPWISVAMDAQMYNYKVNPARGDFLKRFYTVPRTEMARALLQSLPYPSLSSPWQHIEFPKPIVLDPHKALPAEFAGRAAFLRVTVKNLNRDRDALSPFSKENARGTVVPRTWIALPEALSYAADGVVEVRAAYVNQCERLELQIAPPSPADEALISANLCAEAYIYACGQHTKVDRGRPRATGHCALAAYIWAYERVYLLKLAKIFQQRGIGQVTSIGSLQLQVQMTPARVDEADEVALSLSLDPPMRPYETLESSVPAYREGPYSQKPEASGVHQPPSFPELDWILNPQALLRRTSFTFMKAGGTVKQLLDIEALGQEARSSSEVDTLSERAGQAMYERFRKLREIRS
jgi:hypothetical protein